MDTVKVKELIAELEADIRIRQEALQGLRKLLAASPTQEPNEQMHFMRDEVRPVLFSSGDSYIDLAVKIITTNDYKPMKMTDIVDRIRVLKGNPNIQRRSVESTLIQHLNNKGNESRVLRAGRGMWGVRRFPRESSAA